MKISQLYSKKHGFPWITLSVILCCIAVTGISLIWPNYYESLAWSNHPDYVWQYFSGTFLHGNQSGLSMAIAHLMANILIFAPYGIMIENLLGHKRFSVIFLVSYLAVSISFYLIVLFTVPAGESAYGAGLSGSAYTAIAIGAYILFQIFQHNKKLFLQQPLSYIFLGGLIGECIFLMPAIAGISSMLIHLSGILTGAILVLLFKIEINTSLERLASSK